MKYGGKYPITESTATSHSFLKHRLRILSFKSPAMSARHSLVKIIPLKWTPLWIYQGLTEEQKTLLLHWSPKTSLKYHCSAVKSYYRKPTINQHPSVNIFIDDLSPRIGPFTLCCHDAPLYSVMCSGSGWWKKGNFGDSPILQLKRRVIDPYMQQSKL